MADADPNATKPRIKLKVEPDEVATIARDVTRFTFGGVLENLDDTLRTRSRGRGLKIYDELERDAHCYAVLAKRKLAVVSREWQIDAASDSAIDKAAAELVERQVKELGRVIEDGSRPFVTGIDQATENFLDATLKGYSIGEVMWKVRGSEIVADRIIPRNQRRFVFNTKLELRMLVRENERDGIELPPRKFIVHRFGAKDDDPYGRGLGHILFWPVFFKRQDISFWLVFADKFGSPTAVGKYPAGAKKDEKETLLLALKMIAQDSQIIVPDGMLVELLEAKRAGTIDTYEKLARYMDEQMSLAVLGETITTTAKSTGMGSGVADRQNEVRLEVAKADSDMLSDTLNATLVRWIVDYNLPGAGYPRIFRSFEEAEDLEMRSAVDKALHDMGYEPESVEYINETYGGKWVKKKVPQPAAPLAGGRLRAPNADLHPGGADFAEGGDQDVVEQFAEQLDHRTRAEFDKLLEPVRRLVAGAESPDAIREGLLELYPTMDTAAFAQVFQDALTAAELAGRFEAAEPLAASAARPASKAAPAA
jgi:phage gp29-like protein